MLKEFEAETVNVLLPSSSEVGKRWEKRSDSREKKKTRRIRYGGFLGKWQQCTSGNSAGRALTRNGSERENAAVDNTTVSTADEVTSLVGARSYRPLVRRDVQSRRTFGGQSLNFESLVVSTSVSRHF